MNAEIINGENHDSKQLRLLKVVLHALNESNCRYALIHNAQNLERAVLSDVDIAFDCNPNEVLLPILNRLSETGNVQIIQCLHYEIPHGYYYILKIGNRFPCFLHLDCLYDPLGINRYHIPTPFLLKDTVTMPWVSQTSQEKEAIYLLAKRAVKSNISQEGHDVLLNYFSRATDTLWSYVRYWFGPEGRQHVEQLIRSKNLQRAHSHLKNLNACIESRFRYRHPLRYFLSIVTNVMRKIRRFLLPTGLFVVILGPDGSGKSTVTGLVLSQLGRAFRKVWRFHWRPGLLPKLGHDLVAIGKQESTTKIFTEVSKYRGLVSLVRFVYYWLDFVLGYWLLIYPRKAQTTLVLGERYFPDVLVHPQRYGFAIPKWLMRLAAKCVPSPDLLILLKDDPVVIYARKPELPVPRIAEQITSYEKEIKHWGKTAVITTTGGVDGVAARVCNLILNECARNTVRHFHSFIVSNRYPIWRGFPSLNNAKVLVDDRDSMFNALNLYHPYSKLGRLAKSVTISMPRALQRIIYKKSRCAMEMQRLENLTETIYRIFENQALAISFATGTPGPHRKLTAQVSRNKKIIAYAKVGSGEVVHKLLEREKNVLKGLEIKGFSAANVPRVLAFESCGEDNLLVLSSPGQVGLQRPLQPDDKDVTFITKSVVQYTRILSIDEMHNCMGFEARIGQLQAADNRTADLLRHSMECVHKILESSGVKVAHCHGDYTPWNTLELANGSLYVFDWEYASDNSPCLNDLFHRVMMPARLVLRQRPNRTIDQLLDLHNDPLLGTVVRLVDISRTEMPAYILLYLISLIVREESKEGTFSEYLQKALHHSLKVIGHPACRHKILVSAYACEPGGGSEPGVGWNMCQAISHEHEAWVITRMNNKEQIERALTEQPNPYLHFSYVDLPYWARFWKKGGRCVRTYYYLWQLVAWREALRLRQIVNFDLAHHVTFVNDWLFSFLALLPIPFVWGPIGSHPKSPSNLASNMGSHLKDRGRYYFQTFIRVADPLFWLCAYRARLIVGIDKEVGQRFPLSLLSKSKFVNHTAIGVEKIFDRPMSYNDFASGIRVLSMGRLIPVKAFHLAIRSFAKLIVAEPTSKLVIVGKGPERAALQKLAKKLKVSEHVEFIHWLPREEALLEMAKSDVFLYPSFEGGGMVVLEAMAHGLPVVCLNYGGPGDMITQECGFAMEVGSLDDTVQKLAAALKKLAQDKELRIKMGTAARRRIQERYLWKSRHEILSQWYYATLLKTNYCVHK